MHIWNPTTNTTPHTLTDHTGEVLAVGVAPDESWLATGSADGTVRIWDLTTNTIRHTLTDHTRGVHAVGVAPEGSWQAIAEEGVEMWIWNPITRTTRHTRDACEVKVLVGVPDGSWLASATDSGGEVLIWDLTTGTIRHTLTSHTGRHCQLDARDDQFGSCYRSQ